MLHLAVSVNKDLRDTMERQMPDTKDKEGLHDADKLLTYYPQVLYPTLVIFIHLAIVLLHDFSQFLFLYTKFLQFPISLVRQSHASAAAQTSKIKNTDTSI